MSDVGRPSELNDELFLKIRGLVLEGKNMREMAEILEIPYKTMEGWVYRNYEGFADKMLAYKHEKLIQKAETNLDLLLDGEDDKIKADLSKFVLETLAKQNYSKKTETDLNAKVATTVELTDEQLKHLIESARERFAGENTGEKTL